MTTTKRNAHIVSKKVISELGTFNRLLILNRIKETPAKAAICKDLKISKFLHSITFIYCEYIRIADILDNLYCSIRFLQAFSLQKR